MLIAQEDFLGQTKVAFLDDKNQPFAFFITRYWEINYGDIYQGTVIKKMPKLKAYFLDIGNNRQVFLPTSVTFEEGQSLCVQVNKEMRPEKIPSVHLIGSGICSDPHLIEKGKIESTETSTTPWTNEIQEVMEQALEPILYFADGARLIIERTAAFWSIDVDSHQSNLPLSQINTLAASLIGKEIIKRNLSGNIVIDFIGKKKRFELSELMDLLRIELTKSDILFQILGVSPLGNVELRRERHRAYLGDSINGSMGLAYRFLEDLSKNKQHNIQARVSLDISNLLNSLLKNEFETIKKQKLGTFKLVIDPQIKGYSI